MEIEKYRVSETLSRELIELITKKNVEYEEHLQSVIFRGDESETFKNNLKQVLSFKRENDLLSSENSTLQRIAASHEAMATSLSNENSLLSERLNVYLRKLVEAILGASKDITK